MCLIRVSWTGKMFSALLIILSADAHWILLKLEIYSFHSSHAPITVLRFLIHSNYQVIIHPLCGSCISFIKGAKVPGRNFTYINAEICSAKQNDIQSQNFCALVNTTTICTIFHVKALKSIWAFLVLLKDLLTNILVITQCTVRRQN